MLDKIKELYRKNPTLTIIGGGLLLFMFYLLFSRIFARPGRERQAGMPLQVVPPGAQFQPPVPGEAPAWGEAFAGFQDLMRGELAGLREEFKAEARPGAVHFVQEIIRERLPEVPPARVTPIPLAPPDAPVAPAVHAPAPPPVVHAPAPPPVVHTPTPPPVVHAPAPDTGLIARLHADIARVEGRAADPGFRERMAQQWGSVEQYLAGQRARLAAAGAPVPRAPVPPPAAPAAAHDAGLAARLRADITRVEGRAADPGFRERMAAQWGSVEQYLAGQRARLRAVGG